MNKRVSLVCMDLAIQIADHANKVHQLPLVAQGNKAQKISAFYDVDWSFMAVPKILFIPWFTRDRHILYGAYVISTRANRRWIEY